MRLRLGVCALLSSVAADMVLSSIAFVVGVVCALAANAMHTLVRFELLSATFIWCWSCVLFGRFSWFIRRYAAAFLRKAEQAVWQAGG